MIRVYRQEADRQRLLIKKAEVTQNRLLFVVEAMRALREDKDFARLLQTEKSGRRCLHSWKSNWARGRRNEPVCKPRCARRSYPGFQLGYRSHSRSTPYFQCARSERPLKSSHKYRQIASSIREIGLVEPPAVWRDPQNARRLPAVGRAPSDRSPQRFGPDRGRMPSCPPMMRHSPTISELVDCLRFRSRG